MVVNIVIIELSPELEARVRAWAERFGRPGEDLAVELLQEYFDDSDTGARISEAVKAGKAEVYSRDKVKPELHEIVPKLRGMF